MAKSVVAFALVAMGATLSGCYSHDGSLKKINYETLMREVGQCNDGSQWACKTVGDKLLGKTVQSAQSDWLQGHDRVGAKKAYRRACFLGLAQACAAIVEYGLFDNVEEKQRYDLRAHYYSGKVRSAEEVAEDARKMREAVAEQEKEIAAIRRAEEASSRQSWAAFGGAVQQAAPQFQAALNRQPSGHGAAGFGSPTGAGNTPGGLGAPGAAKPDCSPCSAISISACQREAISAACYNAQAQVNECLASRPGCSTNPAAARQEAARLRQAAREVKR